MVKWCAVISTLFHILYYNNFSMISQDQASTISAFATSCYRIMLHIKHRQHPIHHHLWHDQDNIHLSTVSETQQLRFLGTYYIYQTKSQQKSMPSTHHRMAEEKLDDHEHYIWPTLKATFWCNPIIIEYLVTESCEKCINSQNLIMSHIL